MSPQNVEFEEAPKNSFKQRFRGAKGCVANKICTNCAHTTTIEEKQQMMIDFDLQESKSEFQQLMELSSMPVTSSMEFVVTLSSLSLFAEGLGFVNRASAMFLQQTIGWVPTQTKPFG